MAQVHACSRTIDRSCEKNRIIDGEMDGDGTMEWENGDRIEGVFEHGRFPQHALLMTGTGIKRNVTLEDSVLSNLEGTVRFLPS